MPERQNVDPTLIFDIGANNGDDTAFYLAKGFKVVSFEADPEFQSLLSERFANEIRDGRCTIVTCGIGFQHETKVFYRHAHRDWNSFLKNSKATSEGTLDSISVDIRPLPEFLETYGVPYYLKIDIEGYELPALRGADLARYQPHLLSFEINTDWKEILCLLAESGYAQFQLVRQGPQFLPPLPRPAREGATIDYSFNGHMTGPFGRDLPVDQWIGFEEMKSRVAQEFEARRERVARGERPGWHDIHCSRE